MRLNKEQQTALRNLYVRTVKENALPTLGGYLAFRRTVQPMICESGVMVQALGMWFGIEADGHTHT